MTRQGGSPDGRIKAYPDRYPYTSFDGQGSEEGADEKTNKNDILETAFVEVGEEEQLP